MKLILKSIFVFFAVGVGLYPVLYFVADMSGGLLDSKEELLKSSVWVFAFYTHIIFGAIALLSGWSQFFKSIRTKHISLHRLLGKIYVITVIFSGVSGLYIAWYALGGVVSRWGFLCMDICWISATLIAFTFIRKKNFIRHENWMIRSYAVCFAAVTLRLWLPVFAIFTNMEFVESYRIISWLSWIPNLVVAEFIISRIRKNSI